MDARELVETALEPLWRGDWEAHLRWIAPQVAVSHGPPGRPSLWQRLRGPAPVVVTGHAAYTAAMHPIAALIGQAPEHFHQRVWAPVGPGEPFPEDGAVLAVLSGVL